MFAGMLNALLWDNFSYLYWYIVCAKYSFMYIGYYSNLPNSFGTFYSKIMAI